MNPRIYLYLLASFFLTLAAGVRDDLTPAGWIALIAFSFGSALNAGLAYLDRSNGQPPQSAVPGKIMVAVVAIALAFALAGCITLDVSTRLPSGATIRAGTDGRAATLSLNREF